MARLRICLLAIVCVAANKAYASLDTIGPNGIRSDGLTEFDGVTPLTGDGITIGQVEPDRPGVVGFDSPANFNSSVVPAGVFIQDGDPITADMNIGDGHATRVASIIISTDATDSSMPPNGDAPRGVAIDADLYSSAYVTAGVTPGYQDALLTTQHIATLPNMRAINHSWQKPLAPGAMLDGNTQLTLGMDWLANQHDVLMVFAGNQGEMLPVPTDNYNGMTIGSSSKVGSVYRQVAPGNTFTEDAVGERTSISLIAPGDSVETANIGDVEFFRTGTSSAVPHVTGTVALLQQYGDERIMNSGSANWNADARRHEVMKSVLMNSADKIEEGSAAPPNGIAVPPGGYLGMQRTVLKQDGTSTWFDSTAYDDSIEGQGQFFPLDEEMGTGHLNASRALVQFRDGEFGHDDGDIPGIGWDFNETIAANSFNRYQFQDQLTGGSFISITLAWDREVEFATDAGTTGQYDAGDSFAPYVDDGINPPDDSVISGMSLYLLPKFAGSIGQALAASISPVGTVQHIFYQIPTTGEYEFWVYQEDIDDVNPDPGQDYAVSWWADSVIEANLPGDFNMDGMVDGSDLAQWRGDFGQNPDSDADDDGDSDGADFLAWQRNFGMTSAAPTNAAVPEPAAWMLLAVGLSLLFCRRKQRGHDLCNAPVLAAALLACSRVSAQEESKPRDVPLESIVTTSGQEGLKNTRHAFKEESGYLRQIRLDANGSASNAFLVDAANAEGAVRASFSVFLGSVRPATPVPVNAPNPERGSHWLVAYLGTGGSEPSKWIVDGATVEKGRVRLVYRTRNPAPETADSHRYYYWVPLGKLAPGTYEVELFDADEKAVTLMRRVKVEDQPR